MKKITVMLLGIALLASCGKKQQTLPDADNSHAVITVKTQRAQLSTT